LVTAYAVKRPDGHWAVLIVNRDSHVHVIKIGLNKLRHGGLKAATLYQYDSSRYAWQPENDGGHVVRSLPPVERRVKTGGAVSLPALSLTVVREGA
jgi:hypothetical protein